MDAEELRWCCGQAFVFDQPGVAVNLDLSPKVMFSVTTILLSFTSVHCSVNVMDTFMHARQSKTELVLVVYYCWESWTSFDSLSSQSWLYLELAGWSCLGLTQSIMWNWRRSLQLYCLIQKEPIRQVQRQCTSVTELCQATVQLHTLL